MFASTTPELILRSFVLACVRLNLTSHLSCMRAIGGGGDYLLAGLFLSYSICLLGGVDENRTYEGNFRGIFFFYFKLSF